MRWITATDLHHWADTRISQEELSVIVRRLIFASVDRIEHISMPGGDSVNRPGWDGTLTCEQAAFFVPEGHSAWEFGTSSEVIDKANRDYRTRTTNPIGQAPSKTTLVIVTARRWPIGTQTKEDWINTKRTAGPWKNVCVLDADDLETWLEQTPSVAAWLGHVHGKPTDGIEALDAFWDRCTTDTTPELTPGIILAGRESLGEKLCEWSEGNSPIIRIKADTAEEAILLIAAWAKLEKGDAEEFLFSNAIVVYSENAWRQIAAQHRPLVLIPFFPNGALGLGDATRRGHWIIIPSGWSAGEDDVVVAPWLDREKLKVALEGTGLSEQIARRYADNCGRSLQVLARQLSKAVERQAPSWATPTSAQALIPALLAGRWNRCHEGDQEALSILAGQAYDQWENSIRPFFNIQDAPVRQYGDIVVLTSPVDAWRLLGREISQATWDRYRNLILALLQERDPRLDLPPEKRWFSSIYGKDFRHSAQLRDGLVEQLARIAGSEDRIGLGVNPTAGAIAGYLLREALSPPTEIERWISIGPLLPDLAEVAPDEFLSQLEGLIRSPESARLLFQKSDFMSSTSPHVYVMWAIQRARWFPRTLRRCGDCLIALNALDPGDNSSPRPNTVFSETFCPQMPDNVAAYSDQLTLLSIFMRSHGNAVWSLIFSIIPTGRSFRIVDHGPRFRQIAGTPDQPVTWGDLWMRCDTLLALLIEHAGDDVEHWCKLIDMLDDVRPEAADVILSHLRANYAHPSAPSDKAVTIYQHLMSLYRRHEAFPDANWVMPKERLAAIKNLATDIEPDDVVEVVRWLFIEHFPHRYLQGGDKDLSCHRANAVAAIYAKHGFEGLERLASSTNFPGFVGEAIANSDIDDEGKQRIFSMFVTGNETSGVVARCFISSVYSKIAEEAWRYADNLDSRSFGRMAQGFPATPELWDLLAQRGEDAEEAYWKGAGWCRYGDTSEVVTRAVNYLFRYGQNYNAVMTICHADVPLSFALHLRALEAISTILSGQKDGNSINNLRFDAVELFKKMGRCDDRDEQVMLRLEFECYSLLDHTGYGFPFLTKAFENDPAFFIEAIKMSYKREDGAEDEEAASWRTLPHADAIAHHLFNLLHDFDAIPGLKEHGAEAEQKLMVWIEEALVQAERVSRKTLATIKIGESLARAPEAHGQLWPPEHICNAMERFWSDDLGRGFSCGAHNKLGARFVGEGEPDAELALQYKAWSEGRVITHPHVANVLNHLSETFRRNSERHKRDGELRRQTEW